MIAIKNSLLSIYRILLLKRTLVVRMTLPLKFAKTLVSGKGLAYPPPIHPPPLPPDRPHQSRCPAYPSILKIDRKKCDIIIPPNVSMGA